MSSTPSITPTLFYSGATITEIMAFYRTVFQDFEIIAQIVLPPGPVEGKTLARVKMNGLELLLFDVGQGFEFTEGFSLTIHCSSQQEVDDYWEKLIDGGGKAIECGWVQDRFGVFWQIVPTRLNEMLQHPNRQKAAKAFQAMLGMQKMDIAGLERSFEGE